MGVIDRFSRTIKEQIFKDFTENNNVIWQDKLPDYMHAYNNSPHKGILNLTPEEAQSDQHEEDLFNLNLEKDDDLKQNIFQIGNTVRKRLKRPLFTKEYKQIWSNRVYMIESIDGVRETLSNGETIKLNDLQKVSTADDGGKTRVMYKRIEEGNTIQRAMKQGLDVDNILESRRR